MVRGDVFVLAMVATKEPLQVNPASGDAIAVTVVGLVVAVTVAVWVVVVLVSVGEVVVSSPQAGVRRTSAGRTNRDIFRDKVMELRTIHRQTPSTVRALASHPRRPHYSIFTEAVTVPEAPSSVVTANDRLTIDSRPRFGSV